MGRNLYAGMSPEEARWQTPHVMHQYASGMISEVNKITTFRNQQAQSQAIMNFDDAFNSGNLDKAKGTLESSLEASLSSADKTIYNGKKEFLQGLKTISEIVEEIKKYSSGQA
jgi:hypothetical protein